MWDCWGVDIGRRWAIGLILLAVAFPCPAAADQGDPLAVRTWPGGVVSVETFWGLVIVVALNETLTLPAELSAADLIISRSAEQPEDIETQLRLLAASDWTVPATTAEPVSRHWPLGELNLYLDRLANSPQQTLAPDEEATFVSKNAVAISHVGDRLLLLAVDGVRIAVPLKATFAEPADELPVDVLVFNPPTGDLHLPLSAEALAQIGLLQPRWSLITQPLPEGEQPPLARVPGNTWAVSCPDAVAPNEDDAGSEAGDETPQGSDATSAASGTQWVRLGTAAWEMPEELRGLFARKQAACQASQATFAALNAEQLNFVPSNGTHTPRWNCEHMAGRELLFFSQIYAAQAAAIPLMDLNPQQMPADYQPRHADWDGAEEARHMARVSRFTRRFAYLLDGLPLDQPAPGSQWTLRKLLVQMDQHYAEHTANVVKKFSLPDWPTR